jgi:pantoate kinase
LICEGPMKGSNISKAFSPSHITGFFHIHDQSPDPLSRGSLGAGFSLNTGMTTIVRNNSRGTQPVIIKLNGKTTDQAKVSQSVVDLFSTHINHRLPPLLIEHRFTIPMGSGFGSSGAGALSLAYALNSHFSSPLTQTEAARIAHLAEIRCKTGLGTVIAETVGGLEIRTRAGAPGIGQIKTVPVPEHTEVLCLIFGALSTQMALGDPAVRTKINLLGEDLVTRFAQAPSLSAFLDYSREFAEHSGLITDRVRKVMSLLDAAHFQCSMPMFGEGVFTLVREKNTAEILSLFNRFKADSVIIKSTIPTEGGKVIYAA